MRFYVYTLSRPNKSVFYVGKGNDKTNRLSSHESQARHGHVCHKCNVIRKIWKEGGRISFEVVFQTDNEQEAFRAESDTIAKYGRENLTNQTNGGEGTSGWNPDKDWRKRHGQYMHNRNLGNKIWVGKKHKPETIEKMKEHNAMKNPIYRARVSNGLMGRILSDESRKKMSESMKKHYKEYGTPDALCKKRSERMKKWWKVHPASEETGKRLSILLKGKKRTPEQCERIRIGALHRKKRECN